MTDRDLRAYSAQVGPTGNTWGFGQVIAIIFLILPFVSLFEIVNSGKAFANAAWLR